MLNNIVVGEKDGILLFISLFFIILILNHLFHSLNYYIYSLLKGNNIEAMSEFDRKKIHILEKNIREINKKIKEESDNSKKKMNKVNKDITKNKDGIDDINNRLEDLKNDAESAGQDIIDNAPKPE
tara:strand:+ start:45 stop:422 length:378 start_codon:yes stop_codon:yes gene_type:complete